MLTSKPRPGLSFIDLPFPARTRYPHQAANILVPSLSAYHGVVYQNVIGKARRLDRCIQPERYCQGNEALGHNIGRHVLQGTLFWSVCECASSSSCWNKCSFSTQHGYQIVWVCILELPIPSPHHCENLQPQSPSSRQSSQRSKHQSIPPAFAKTDECTPMLLM